MRESLDCRADVKCKLETFSWITYAVNISTKQHGSQNPGGPSKKDHVHPAVRIPFVALCRLFFSIGITYDE